MSRAIPADEKTPGVVARYKVRPPITPERRLGEANQAQIIYRSDAVPPRHQANFRALDPPGLPRRGERTHPRRPREDHALPRPALSPSKGWDSNRMRGYRKQEGLFGEVRTVEPAPDNDARGLLEIRRSWARLIRKVYEVDPLIRSRCGGTMTVIAVTEQPVVIRQILDYLGLPTGAAPLRAPLDPAEGWVAESPREWSYELALDDLPIPALMQRQPGLSGGRAPSSLSRLLDPRQFRFTPPAAAGSAPTNVDLPLGCSWDGHRPGRHASARSDTRRPRPRSRSLAGAQSQG